MKTKKINCLKCNKEFDVLLKEVKRGNGKYCSRICSSTVNEGKQFSTRQEIFCSNPQCNKKFVLTDYILKKRKNTSKSGLVFCCRKCKDFCQSLKSPIEDLKLPHYGKGIFDYRKFAFEQKQHSCEKCGYDKIAQILEVHHKDRNRKNNNITNLEILCPNCHDEEHYLTNSGKWQKKDLPAATDMLE
jgi:5-methylcytosine-specific restriction endonuclease McrA